MSDRKERREKIEKLRDLNRETRAQGVPRPVKVGRLPVRFNAPASMFITCVECGYERWKWLKACPRCGA